MTEMDLELQKLRQENKVLRKIAWNSDMDMCLCCKQDLKNRVLTFCRDYKGECKDCVNKGCPCRECKGENWEYDGRRLDQCQS